MTKRVRTTRRLEVWLKETSVALFVLNVQRRLVFFNSGCEKLTGWVASDLLGQVSHFLSEADTRQPNALLASLAAADDVWRGEAAIVPALLAVREADPLPVIIHFYPLTDPNNKVQAVLGVIRESTTDGTPLAAPRTQRLHLELATWRHSLCQQYGPGTLLGRSPAMRRVLDQVKLAEQSQLPVLFIGETGTGKQHLARQIHLAGARERQAFVPLDCRRLPAHHLEETLQRLIGTLADEALQPGTVFLDHIESLPRELQLTIKDLIESKHARKPRVMAASHRPLESHVEADDVILDLYYALTPLTISLPPLRNRFEDLELLAQHFLEELNRDQEQQINGFHDQVWQQFRRYDWPGNVAELRRVVTEARLHCAGSVIEVDHLPLGFRSGADRQTMGPKFQKRTVPLDPLLLQVEREQIEFALVEARHNKAKAAELLGITRPRLYRRMEILGIANTGEAERDGEYEE